MKQNRLLIGGLGLTAIAVAAVLSVPTSTTSETTYVRTAGSLDVAQTADEAQEWLRSKMIDVNTGEVITNEALRQIMEAHAAKPKAITVEWVEHGPDNVGGRTRSIIVDKTNSNIIWSGGVSGGLFKSVNAANNWSRVSNFPGNQFISSIAQDADGNVYVATGSLNESWNGNGIYVTPDGGETWELVPGTGAFSTINRVATSPSTNVIYFATSAGLRSFAYGDASISTVPGYGGTGCRVITASPDGEVLVAGATNNRTWVSQDWGITWDDRSGNAAGQISASGYARIEYAISGRKADGSHNIYAATSSSNNQGQWVSNNTGQTWERHTPATGAGITSGVIDYRDQGTYNNIVTYDPTDPNRAIVGGIDLHEWKQVIQNPASGGWNKISLWFTNKQSPLYVHADNHAMAWDYENNIFYMGNDGGIGKSIDLANTFYPASRGYNTIQFYKIGYDRNGAVIGGAQDNGTMYNDHTGGTYQEAKEVTGGDGFSTVISFFNPNIIFTTSQYNSVRRTGAGGSNFNSIASDNNQLFNSFLPPFPGTYGPVGDGGGAHPFVSQIFLGEHYDLNAEDSVTFIPQRSYAAGQTVLVPSLATGDTIKYITPTAIAYDDTLDFDPALTTTEYIITDGISGNQYDLGILNWTPFVSASGNYPPLVGDTLTVDAPIGPTVVRVNAVQPYDFYYGSNPLTGETIAMHTETVFFAVSWDTLRVQDPFQSWFLVSTSSNGGELWGTRDALRLSVLNPKWVRLAENLGSSQVDVEFSEDLNHMFVCGGPIYRFDGMGSVYTSDPDFVDKLSLDETGSAITRTTISNLNFSGIGIDHRNPDVLVAVQGFSGSAYRSSNATSATPSLTNVGSQGGLAFYDVVVDRADDQVLFAATFNGASLSENGGAAWTDVSDLEFAGTPSYHIMQSWRNWEEGNRREGEVYLGTYGRGLWSTDATLSVAENNLNNSIKETKKPTISVFPNPARYNSTLVFELNSTNDVDIQFYNISGRLVKTVQKTNLMEGRNEVVFSTSELPQGTYIIRVRAGQEIQTTKFIKM